MMGSEMRIHSTDISRRGMLGAGLAGVGLLVLPRRLRAAGPGEAPMTALTFDGDALLAAGPGLYRREDAGGNWTASPAPSGILALATHPERPGRIVAGLAEGGVALSEDGGRSWEARNVALAEGEVAAVSVAAGNSDMIYAAVRGDGLWKSEDAGRTWAFAMDRPWLDEAERDVLALASVDLASGMGGIWIYAGTETGLTRVPDCFCRWQDVQPGNAMDALAAGDAPPSTAPLPPGEPVQALASAPAPPGTLYAALPSGIWASGDGGVIWARMLSGAASAVAVHPDDEMRVVAAVDGALQQSRDGGVTWSVLAAA